MKEYRKHSAYKQAGVDIDVAADLVEDIKPALKNTARAGMMSGIGGFGALFDPKAAGYDDPILVSSTDGVGTKIKISVDSGIHNTIGIDAVAMCVNDLVVQGAEPLFFLDYFATGKLDKAVAKSVIEGVAQGCSIAGCGLIGGETAEMPGVYADGDYDLAGFTVGAVNRGCVVTGESIAVDDVILGLGSNGVHSNGYSLVRHILSNKNMLDYDAPVPFNMTVTMQDAEAEKQTRFHAETLADALLAPTRIYVKSLLKALKIRNTDDQIAIKGMAHITGGGLTENIPRVLPDNVAAHIDVSQWELPEIFRWLMKEGDIEPHDLARTLNCGIGMVVICDAKDANAIEESLTKSGETVYRIGHITEQTRDDRGIFLDNLSSSWGS